MDEPDSLETRTSFVSRLRDPDDAQTWGDFYGKYHSFVMAVARRKGLSIHDAQDVSQEVMTAVAKILPDFDYDRKRGRFRGLLSILASRRTADFFRKEQSLQKCLQAVRERDCSEGEETDLDWQQSILRAAIELVKRRSDGLQFQAFELTKVHGLKPSVVAGMLGVSAPKVSVWSHRILERVRKVAQSIEARVE